MHGSGELVSESSLARQRFCGHFGNILFAIFAMLLATKLLKPGDMTTALMHQAPES
jgi:hypothetical protein